MPFKGFTITRNAILDNSLADTVDGINIDGAGALVTAFNRVANTGTGSMVHGIVTSVNVTAETHIANSLSIGGESGSRRMAHAPSTGPARDEMRPTPTRSPTGYGSLAELQNAPSTGSNLPAQWIN